MTATRVSLGGRPVGPGEAPFIIAEVGLNHNGDVDRALKMIAVAKKAGVDAVKFQTFKAAEFVGDPKQTFTYKSRGKKVTESMLKMFQRYELPASAWKTLRARCDKEGVAFLSTPQNLSDLELLLKVGVTAVKVGSDDFTNIPLLKSYAAKGLPMIVSCGMADLKEVHQALEALGAPRHPTVLLLCTSQYPTPPADANLLRLRTLAETFPGLTLGFSDHTQGPLAASLAVALGACVFEKHFTLDQDLPGPDHWFSEDPAGLTEWVRSIRAAHALLGSSAVEPTKAELAMRVLARRSVTVLSDIKAGATLTASNIGLRRPGNGLAPALYETVLGRKAARALRKGASLQKEDFR